MSNIFDYPLIALSYALILTIAIELALAYLLKFRGKDEYKVIIAMNICTNLVLNLSLIGILNIFWRMSEYTYNNLTLVFELIVIFTEFLILTYVFGKEYSKKKLFLIALILNIGSYGIGAIISSIL